jgi:rhodanese-related sulfurtransferase
MHVPLTQVSPAVPEISREEILRRLRDPSLVIVDVLPPPAYAEAHIAGAISLPLGEIRALAPEALPDPTREIAVYCGGFT